MGGARTTIILSGVGLAAAAFVLDQLDYRAAVRSLPTEIFVLAVAALFAALGVYVGGRLAGGPRAGGFTRNEAAAKSLGLSPREIEILEAVAAGRSTKEAARDLGVSPETVKTHLSNLYRKLEASRRTEAIDKARRLDLIP